MTQPLVSIIIPCYNQAQYLTKAIDSVLCQTFPNWECIIIDDGSTDITKEVFQQYQQKDERISSISIPNSGVCVAKNIGIRNSFGKYIFPLDSDNYLHPTCIEKCLNIFQNNANIKLVYTEAELFGLRSGLMNLPEYSFKKMLSRGIIDNSAMFLREDFDRVGGYRISMKNGLEDWDLWIALLSIYDDSQVYKIKEVLYYYRTNVQSRSISIEAQGIFSQMKDLLVYNNYAIYQKYFPDIFFRIQRFDYYEIMMNKPLIKVIGWLYNQLSKIKANLKSL